MDTEVPTLFCVHLSVAAPSRQKQPAAQGGAGVPVLKAPEKERNRTFHQQGLACESLLY
jgi:hypothetical protein